MREQASTCCCASLMSLRAAANSPCALPTVQLSLPDSRIFRSAGQTRPRTAPLRVVLCSRRRCAARASLVSREAAVRVKRPGMPATRQERRDEILSQSHDVHDSAGQRASAASGNVKKPLVVQNPIGSRRSSSGRVEEEVLPSLLLFDVEQAVCFVDTWALPQTSQGPVRTCPATRGGTRAKGDARSWSGRGGTSSRST